MHLHGIQGLGITNPFNAIEALGDQLGQAFKITGTGNRNQVIATTSGVNLTDSLDIGESLGDSFDLSLFGVDQDDGILHGDRKSTRLNSSHVAISYAVFCLKKKNKPNTHG